MNQLSSFFSRLGRSRVFWLCVVVMIALAVRSGAMEFTVADQAAQDRWAIILFGEMRLELPIILAIFASMFLGGEYDGGAIRNKLIVGCARWRVYSAALVTVSAVAVGLALLYAGVAAVLCWLAHGPMPDPSRLPVYLAAVLLVCVAWSALFTALGMNCIRPSVSIVTCLAVVGVTFLICTRFLLAEIIAHDNCPEAALSRFFYNLLPIGQGDQLRFIETDSLRYPPEALMPYSAMFIVLTTGAGLPLFLRKDLK